MSCGECTKCCEAIRVEQDIFKRENLSEAIGDIGYARDNWTHITSDEAFTINPLLKTKPVAFYFKCKNLTPNGCGDYDNRPSVCSGYPYYGADNGSHASRSKKALVTRYVPNEYTENCGLRVNLIRVVTLS